MPMLPLRAHLKMYRGSKPELQRRAMQENALRQRVAEYVNRLIANDPSEIQQYLFGFIASDLGVTVDEVRNAISDGGYNGITFRVSDRDRDMLRPYMDAPKAPE